MGDFVGTPLASAREQQQLEVGSADPRDGAGYDGVIRDAAD